MGKPLAGVGGVLSTGLLSEAPFWLFNVHKSQMTAVLLTKKLSERNNKGPQLADVGGKGRACPLAVCEVLLWRGSRFPKAQQLMSCGLHFQTPPGTAQKTLVTTEGPVCQVLKLTAVTVHQGSRADTAS